MVVAVFVIFFTGNYAKQVIHLKLRGPLWLAHLSISFFYGWAMDCWQKIQPCNKKVMASLLLWQHYRCNACRHLCLGAAMKLRRSKNLCIQQNLLKVLHY